MVAAESWFRKLWKVPQRHESGHEKELVGVLAFEVASLMSKLVYLWQSLGDKQISKLREDLRNSVGLRKLVSEDEEIISRLICSEMIDGLIHVAKSVARLGKKCRDPSLKSFEHIFDELINIGFDPYSWGFTWKKMDKKVKKMEQFISINATLYQEMELLADLEQTVRRMKSNDPKPDNLLENQKKLAWKKQQVKNLRDISLWNRTYDYIVFLLARSLFTIFGRISLVFGFAPMDYSGELKAPTSGKVHGYQSVSPLLQSPICPSENGSIPRFASGPLGRFATKSDPNSKPKKGETFYSGPLRDSSASGPISGKTSNVNFFSGPLGNPEAKLGTISGMHKSGKKTWRIFQSPIFRRTKPQSKPNISTQVGPFKGFMAAGNSPADANSTVDYSGNLHGASVIDYLSQNCTANARPSIFRSKFKLLNALPETLGAAALALHYANVIIVIEKLAASPHLIGDDARDDLYNMLPESVKTALRVRLKPYSRSLAASVYDSELAQEWTEAIASILEWLAPLAHNMIRWQSERSFEQQSFVSRTNVLLAQTLYFANKEKTEATIIELLVGLNYVWRFGRELNTRVLSESTRVFDGI